jgi:3-hydroxyisobutyrate dehydrogenase-like beta-hydroxyacid dehydrogenase
MRVGFIGLGRQGAPTASLAEGASAPEGVVFTAADAALTSMDHPR